MSHWPASIHANHTPRASTFGRRTLTALLLLSALFGASMTLSPARAEAASCFAYSCNGVDPYAGGCADGARTLSSNGTNGTAVQLRYSDRCNAAWVRIVDPNACVSNPEGRVRNSAGNVQVIPRNQLCAGYGATDTAYSKMVSDTTGQWAEACVTQTTKPATWTGVATICTARI